jgi:Cyclin
MESQQQIVVGRSNSVRRRRLAPRANFERPRFVSPGSKAGNVAGLVGRGVGPSQRRAQNEMADVLATEVARSAEKRVSERVKQCQVQRSSRTQQRQAVKVVASQLLESWIAQCADSAHTDPEQFAREIVDSIVGFLKFYGGSQKRFVLPWMFYTRRALERRELAAMSARELFHLALVGALITVKFWNDFEVANRDAAKIFQIPLKTLSQMERDFLADLDYNLFLPSDTLRAFKRCIRIKAASLFEPQQQRTLELVPGPSSSQSLLLSSSHQVGPTTVF